MDVLPASIMIAPLSKPSDKRAKLTGCLPPQLVPNTMPNVLFLVDGISVHPQECSHEYCFPATGESPAKSS